MSNSITSLSSSPSQSEIAPALHAFRPPSAGIALPPRQRTRSVKYDEAVSKRRKLFHDNPSRDSSTFEYLLTIPQSNPVNALALSACSSHLYAGGSDGFIRRFSVYETLAGTNNSSQDIENLLPYTNPTANPTHTGVLVGYWENCDVDTNLQPGDRFTKAKFGPRSTLTGNGSPVHSLLVDQDEMFSLAGSEDGNINLFGIRLDEGQCRHVFKTSSDAKGGHKEYQAVSSLLMSRDGQSFISGGWDARVLQWDLNSGKVVKHFEHASSPITSLSWRPTSTSSPVALPIFNEAADDDVPNSRVQEDESTKVATPPSAIEEEEKDPLFDEEDLDAEGSSTDGGGQDIAASLVASTNSQGANENKNGGLTLPSKTASKNDVDRLLKPDLPRLPHPFDTSLPDLSQDVLLGSCIDGRVLLWDRRSDSKESVRCFPRPESKGTPWAMNTAWADDGNSIYVGRRNGCLDIYDIRSSARSRSRIVMPQDSGPVTAILPLNQDKILVASCDDLRLLEKSSESYSFQIVPGHSGGPVSSLVMDPLKRFFISAAGARDFQEWPTSSDGISIFLAK